LRSCCTGWSRRGSTGYSEGLAPGTQIRYHDSR